MSPLSMHQIGDGSMQQQPSENGEVGVISPMMSGMAANQAIES